MTNRHPFNTKVPQSRGGGMICLMDSEIITVLREIRDESKQTNLRLESLEGRVEQTNLRLESLEGRVEQTNLRLESLEGRVEFVEKRLSHGLEGIKATLVESIDLLTKQQTESELRLSSEVVSLADVTREVRDLLSGRLDDHRMILEHEERLKSIENRIADR
jgi:chromosome segregation ATPase